MSSTHQARSRDHQSAGGKCHIVTGIEAMPDSAQSECQNSAILFRHTLIDNGAQPAICAAIPIVDCIAHIGSELQGGQERSKSILLLFVYYRLPSQNSPQIPAH